MAKQTPAAGAGPPRKGKPSVPARAAVGSGSPGAVSAQDLSAVRAADISFDEQIEIIGEINDVVERNRIEIRPDTFSFTPRKRGSVVPILVNVCAVAAVVLAGFVLLRVFNREEQVLTGQSASLLTAEGRIIEAIREQSEAQLSAKDQEILRIQGRLEELRGERERLRLEMDVRIQEREEQLRAALAEELEAERRRLQQAGVSASNIQQQLSDLESRLTQEQQQQLAEFRVEAEAELGQKDDEIARLIQENNSMLARFREERAALQQELARQEAELRAQAQAQTAAIESERTQIAGQLAQLQSERERERVVLDQILAQYTQVRGHLGAGRYAQAVESLAALESYLAQDSVAAMPAVQRRLPIERFTISSLRELIRLQQSSTGQLQAASQADTLLASIRDTVVEADRRAEAGDANSAIALYQQAVDTIPEVRRSHATLLEATTFGSLDQIQREMRQSEEALRRLQEQLRQAQSRITQQSREISRLESAARSSEPILQQIRDLRARYAGAQARADQVAAAAQERVLEMLEVKVRVRQALAAEPIKSQSPGLYEALEEYLDAYGREQQQVGREAALEEAIAALESLSRRGVRLDLQSIKASYGGGSGDLFLRFLDRLEALLR